MAGLDPAIHAVPAAAQAGGAAPACRLRNHPAAGTAWMAGSSPAMTGGTALAGRAIPVHAKTRRHHTGNPHRQPRRTTVMAGPDSAMTEERGAARTATAAQATNHTRHTRKPRGPPSTQPSWPGLTRPSTPSPPPRRPEARHLPAACGTTLPPAPRGWPGQARPSHVSDTGALVAPTRTTRSNCSAGCAADRPSPPARRSPGRRARKSRRAKSGWP